MACVFSGLVRAIDLGLGCLGCFAPDVAVVETTHTGKPDNLRTRRWSRFERPPVRRISEPRMNAFSVVVGDVFAKPPMQMTLVEHDHVVQELPPAGPDPPFGQPVLPWTPIGRADEFCVGSAVTLR